MAYQVVGWTDGYGSEERRYPEKFTETGADERVALLESQGIRAFKQADRIRPDAFNVLYDVDDYERVTGF